MGRACEFAKYMGRGEKMFATTEDIDNYIRESRADRNLPLRDEKETMVASRFGVAKGKFEAPDDIDKAKMKTLN